MSGYRRTALALHALAETDRRWLLSRLADAQRERLEPLLGELGSLGARFDPTDLEVEDVDEDRRGQRADSGALPPPQPQPPVTDPLATLEAEALGRVLAAEPDWIVAALWHGAPETSRGRLREAIGSKRPAAFVDAGDGRGAALRPAVYAALVAALQRSASSGAVGSGSFDRALPGASSVDASSDESERHAAPVPPGATRFWQRLRSWKT